MDSLSGQIGLLRTCQKGSTPLLSSDKKNESLNRSLNTMRQYFLNNPQIFRVNTKNMQEPDSFCLEQYVYLNKNGLIDATTSKIHYSSKTKKMVNFSLKFNNQNFSPFRPYFTIQSINVVPSEKGRESLSSDQQDTIRRMNMFFQNLSDLLPSNNKEAFEILTDRNLTVEKVLDRNFTTNISINNSLKKIREYFKKDDRIFKVNITDKEAIKKESRYSDVGQYVHLNDKGFIVKTSSVSDFSSPNNIVVSLNFMFHNQNVFHNQSVVPYDYLRFNFNVMTFRNGDASLNSDQQSTIDRIKLFFETLQKHMPNTNNEEAFAKLTDDTLTLEEIEKLQFDDEIKEFEELEKKA